MKKPCLFLSKSFNLKIPIVLVFILVLIISGKSQLYAQEKTLKVAGLQMNVTRDIEQNKKTIIKYIKKASEAGAEFLITPEGSLSGYTNEFDQQKLEDALAEVLKAAKAAELGLFLGTCFEEKVNNKTITYNQVRVYASSGELMGKHSKILLCSPIDAPGTGEMHDYGQGRLNLVEWKDLKIGILICNDLWATPGYTTISNSYLPMQLKQMGADVIFHSINSGVNQRYRKFHESSAELWAFSNGIPIVAVNAAHGEKPINAQSGLIDANGERSVKVPLSGEQLFIAEFSLGSDSNIK